MKKFLFTRALAAKKKIYSLLAVFVAVSTFNRAYAADYTIKETPDPASPILSYVIPLVPQTSTASSATQQIYLASDLTDLGASSGSISGIKLYYGGKLSSGTPTAVTETVTRNLKIYLTTVNDDALTCYDIAGAYVTNYRFKFLNQGSSLVHEGNVSTEITAAGEIKTLSITFNKGSFAWDGSSNLLLTIFDVTNTAYTSAGANLRFELMNTDGPRFVHQYWTASGANKAEDYLSTLTGFEGYSYTSSTGSTAKEKQINGHKYVAKITFCIDEITLPSVPTGLAASDSSTTSITLSWIAASSATTYDLQYKDGETWKDLASDIDGISYTWTGRDANTSYEVRVRASNSAGKSDWSDAVTVTTDAVHSHNGIEFDKWTSTNSLPTSGDWYLANDVTFGWDNTDVTLTGDLNLCLNGKNADLAPGWRIIIPDGKTLSIFDDATGGSIIGPNSFNGFTTTALIEVQDGGTLVLNGVAITNNQETEDETAYAILVNNGASLHISGKTEISAQDAAIYLGTGSVITLDDALSNTTPISVNAAGQTITSGWSTHMSGSHPSDFFTSAKNTHPNVNTAGGEVYLVPESTIKLADNADNSSPISNSQGGSTTVLVDRAFTDVQYNTICLPFALSSYNLESIFGSGYDLRELNSSELNGEELELFFTQPSEFVAGKPYLIKPAKPVAGFLINGASLTVTDPVTAESDLVDFHGTFSPTPLTGGDKNLLFLGAGNELFWPEATGNLNGFRAYFEVKGAAKNAVRARIVQKDNTATGLENQMVNGKCENGKFLHDGQLYLMYEGKMYDVRGQRVR